MCIGNAAGIAPAIDSSTVVCGATSVVVALVLPSQKKKVKGSALAYISVSYLAS